MRQTILCRQKRQQKTAPREHRHHPRAPDGRVIQVRIPQPEAFHHLFPARCNPRWDMAPKLVESIICGGELPWCQDRGYQKLHHPHCTDADGGGDGCVYEQHRPPGHLFIKHPHNQHTEQHPYARKRQRYGSQISGPEQYLSSKHHNTSQRRQYDPKKGG